MQSRLLVRRSMLADAELRDWLENLSQTNERRKKIIDDLLRHAVRDGMSADDHADCMKALALLKEGNIPERPGPKAVAPSLVEVEVEH
jgi:hypothetical protein